MSTQIGMMAAALLALAGCATGGTQAPAALAPGDAGGAFVCDDGQRLELDHDRPAGVLRATMGGETVVLQEQPGARQARFAAGSDTLVLDADAVRLERGRTARRTCQRLPGMPVAGAIWGTLSKADRMALPAGTRAKVLLVDAARADAPAIEIASTVIVTQGNQMPLTFLLRFPPEAVQPRPQFYRVQARIESPAGQLMYITDTATFVLEEGPATAPVELMLARVPDR